MKKILYLYCNIENIRHYKACVCADRKIYLYNRLLFTYVDKFKIIFKSKLFITEYYSDIKCNYYIL